MHMKSNKESNSEEMDTLRRSRTFTVVLAASGEVHSHEEAQVFVHDFNLFITLQFMKICQRTVPIFYVTSHFSKFLSDRTGAFFCMNAGFLTTVEVGQYFMTKDTEKFSQLTDSVALSWVHLAKRKLI